MQSRHYDKRNSHALVKVATALKRTGTAKGLRRREQPMPMAIMSQNFSCRL